MKTMKIKEIKTSIWILILVALCVLSLLIYALKIATKTDENQVAVIEKNGEVIREIDLNTVFEPYEFTVTANDGGYNKIRVETDKIAVIDADCPDGLCVKRGYIHSDTIPIVCLPHRLSIVIKGDRGEIDVTAGGN